eukprot:1484738-Prymnesium_polylepis.1
MHWLSVPALPQGPSSTHNGRRMRRNRTRYRAHRLSLSVRGATSRFETHSAAGAALAASA